MVVLVALAVMLDIAEATMELPQVLGVFTLGLAVVLVLG
jgi:hypothetical protein